MIRFLYIALAFLCVGCAPNFSGAHIHYQEPLSSPPSFNSFSLKVNDQLVPPSPEIIKAYSTSLNQANLNQECKVDVSIEEFINQKKQSLWYLGAILMIPFWPAMPVEVSLHMQSSITITCQGIIVQRLDFIEEDDFDFFWYGPFRSLEIETKSDWLHEKMIKRLEFALQYQAPVDAGCASDF